MLKNTDNLHDLLDFKNQKEDFDQGVVSLLDIIKKETGLILKSENIFIKKNTLKIKTSSNFRFLILLKINKIQKEVNLLKRNLIVEL